MLGTLPQEFTSRLQTQWLQTIELLVYMLGSNPDPWFHELVQPLGAMTGSIDAGARTRNGPATVQRFDPIHGAGDIFGDGQIAAPQLFQGAHPMLSVVDRLELVGA